MSGGHLGDAISALVDGELAPLERAAAERHLASCAACRGELRAVTSVRDLVRGLPARVPRRRHAVAAARVARAAPWVAAAAAAVAMAALVSRPPSDSVHPQVTRFVEAHSTAPVAGEPVTDLAPAAATPALAR